MLSDLLSRPARALSVSANNNMQRNVIIPETVVTIMNEYRMFSRSSQKKYVGFFFMTEWGLIVSIKEIIEDDDDDPQSVNIERA